MSSREFSEWQAYARLEPIGYSRGDVQAALLASAVANLVRTFWDRETRPDSYEIADFLLRFVGGDEQEEEEPWKGHLRTVEMLNMLYGGVDKRGNSGDAGR